MKNDKLEALELLKGEFVEIYTELNYLKEEEGKNLEALYYSKIGYRELELYEKEIETLSLKRKIELLNSCINRGLEIDIEEIEEKIKLELETYYENLFKLFTKVVTASDRVENLVVLEKEVQVLYRKLAKKLHPDFNESTELFQEYWMRLQEYYNTQNLEGMKALEIMLEIEKIEEITKIEIIEEKISEFLDKIKKMYQEKWGLLKMYPYNMKLYLEDEGWIKEKIESLEEKIKEFDLKIKELTLLFKMLEGERVWVN